MQAFYLANVDADKAYQGRQPVKESKEIIHNNLKDFGFMMLS